MRQWAAAAAIVVASVVSAAAISQGSTAPPTPPTSTCSASTLTGKLPSYPTGYRAGTAGQVVLRSGSNSTIVVSSVAPASSYRPIVDKGHGRTVEVYFSGKTSQVVFSAESTPGALELRVTTCH